MTVVVLMIRHGAHDRLGKVLCGRMDGVGLNEAGLAEGRALGRRLQPRGLAAVYCSPLLRARQTAEPIAKACGLDPQVEDDLNEIDFGDWTGRAFDALHQQSLWSAWNLARGLTRPPGGETMLECQARLARFIERTVGRHAGQTVAAVSHSDVIKSAACHVLGLPLDQHDRFEISPASITAVVAGEWGAKIHSMNEAA